ncbi:hypothetical protein [Chlamydiifrater phoenicopteri]|uniref:hypothetical protein n=1 Tax=Chlamydiifrater phoenicopteri TaxID=2681469 RepID=UPI001BCAD59F|nr:hypothetical protein [Chlamydiifrater phoenicopteri]
MSLSPTTSLAFSRTFLQKEGGALEKTIAALDRILAISSKCIQFVDVTSKKELLFQEDSFSISSSELALKTIIGILLLPLTILALALSIILKGVFYYKHSSKEFKESLGNIQPKDEKKKNFLEKGTQTENLISQHLPQHLSTEQMIAKLKAFMVLNKQESGYLRHVFDFLKSSYTMLAQFFLDFEKDFSTKIFTEGSEKNSHMLIHRNFDMFLKSLTEKIRQNFQGNQKALPEEGKELSLYTKELIRDFHSIFMLNLSLLEKTLDVSLLSKENQPAAQESIIFYQKFDLFFEWIINKVKLCRSKSFLPKSS